MAKSGMLGEVSPQPRARLRKRWSARGKTATPQPLQILNLSTYLLPTYAAGVLFALSRPCKAHHPISAGSRGSLHRCVWYIHEMFPGFPVQPAGCEL